MSKVIKKILIILLFGVSAAIVAAIVRPEESTSQNIICIIATSIAGSVVSGLYEFVDTRGQGLKCWFKTQIQYANEDLRLSFSYLYRIEIDGKYLLVQGKRLEGQYQPIGGVYKYYEDAKGFLLSIKAKPDISMKNHDETDDLRIRIKGKYYLKFYDWFLSMKNREYDPTREFYEELIAEGILSAEAFQKISYQKIWTYNSGVRFSVPLQVNEIIYADIFELKLTAAQKENIKKALLQYPDKICLASQEEITCRCVNSSVRMNVGNNAVWLLGEECE